MELDDLIGGVDDDVHPVAPPRLSVMTTGLDSPTARMLIDALDTELAQRYPGIPIEVPLSPAEVSGGTGTFLIAYQHGEPVGCGAVRQLHDDTGEILRMFVRPELRGHGIGATILDTLEQEARDLGLSELVLETADRLEESIALYERRGYHRTEPQDPLLGEHSVFMRKSL